MNNSLYWIEFKHISANNEKQVDRRGVEYQRSNVVILLQFEMHI